MRRKSIFTKEPETSGTIDTCLLQQSNELNEVLKSGLKGIKVTVSESPRASSAPTGRELPYG